MWAAAIGIGLGGERLTVLTALGAVLMVVGTYWGQAVEHAHRNSRPVKGSSPWPTTTPTSV
ncbi:hypothetical protein [Streptomyces cavernae]|uniref:hypothetical protein n=1 Tax=Streptomyces cavernae TaxID=2259034 RepID=UPI003B75CC8D